MAYDGSIKIDTKIDTSGFSSGIDKLKSLASTGATAIAGALTAATAALAAGATAAATVGSSFEAGMSKVSAISGATGSDLQKLTDKAKEMGATTKFSATESASALQYMAMAGWDTQSMIDGIGGIMSLAAADGLDLASTSDIVTDALTAFGLSAKDSNHFADVLAKTSSSANTNVSMLGETFKYVAPVAGSLGLSVESTAEAIGLMANAGIKSTQAGTALRSMLTRLSTNAGASSNSLGALDILTEKLGVSFYDSKGKVRDLNDILSESRVAWSKLTAEEQSNYGKTIAGQEALSGWLALMNTAPDDVDKLRSSIASCDGAAENMANTMQDNLQGQITILKSGLEGLGIEIYDQMKEPLKEAAVEAQNYVGQLTDAFKSDGLPGLIEEVGNIFGELAVKAAEQAPKMVEAAISFLKAFVNGIANNSGKLIEAGKSIVDTLVNNLLNLLPDSIKKPLKELYNSFKNNFKDIVNAVKDFVKSISESFKNGGLKSAVDTVKNLLKKLGDIVAWLTKTILPVLAKVIDGLAGSMKVWLPIVTGIVAAYKTYSIVSAVTAMITAQTAAVTAETLAEAASTGAITLKQIAVGVLTGEIGLATAAQYAWNVAMSANPIGLVVTAIAALVAGITMLVGCMGEDEEKTDELAEAKLRLEDTNKRLGDSYEGIGDKFSDFLEKIENSGSIFDNFNENILISDEEKQALDDNMSQVQSEITEICKSHAEDRSKLTEGEVQRLDELFKKMHELTEQELAIEQAKQGVVTTQAEALNRASDISLDEYTERASKLANTAEETRTAVIGKAEEQYYEEVALLDQRLKTDQTYSQAEHDAAVDAAEKKYQSAIDAANKEAGATLAIIEKGYKDRASAMTKGTDDLKKLQEEETKISHEYSKRRGKNTEEYYARLKQMRDDGYSESEYEFQRQIALEELNAKNEDLNKKELEDINKNHNDQQKILNNENYQNQLSSFLGFEALYETYTGKTNEHAENIVNAFIEPMNDMPQESYEKFAQAIAGGIEGLESKENTLYHKAANIAGNVISIFKKVFDEHSPSKVFDKIFRYTIQGGEGGLDDEAPKLFKQAEDIGDEFTDKLERGVSAEGLVDKMKKSVKQNQFEIGSSLVAKVLHDVNVSSDENNKKIVLSGDISTVIQMDGREVAVATAPYMSEEMAWSEVS